MGNVDQLYLRLPHSGSMCLVDEVIEWDPGSIRCGASSHRHIDNPLRVGDRLPTICMLEYAAQAFALHGLLVADESGDKAPDSSRVFLALVNSLEFHTDYLDDCRGDLTIDGQIVFRQASSAVYRFAVTEEARLLGSGQIGLMS